MPIYEYRCSCGHQFEKLSRINESSKQICPQCGGEAKKIFSVFQTNHSAWADNYSVSPECGG